MDDLIKKLPNNGYWKICNCHVDCSMGKFIASYEKIEGDKYIRHTAYGETIEEALQKLVGLTSGDKFGRDNNETAT